MEELKFRFQQLPQQFWLYNWVFSLAIFLMNDNFKVFSLVLFPFAVVLTKYLFELFGYKNHQIMNYLGVYPLPKDIVSIVLTFIASWILWHASVGIIVLSIIFGAIQMAQNKN